MLVVPTSAGGAEDFGNSTPPRKRGATNGELGFSSIRLQQWQTSVLLFSCFRRTSCGRLSSTMSRHHGSAFRLKTAAELARDPGAQPPRGEFLYRPTKQVRFPSPIVSIRRRYRQEGVYCERGRTVYYRSYKRPADPKTARQAEQRAGFGGSQSDWKNLTETEREGWTAYGKLYFAGEHSFSPGPNAYTRAQSCRHGWGEAMSRTPPVLPPPALPLLLEEVSAPAPGQIAFRLEHTQADRAGYRIELRMTGATINNRKPQEPQFARAGESAPESFFSLAESGALYLLQRPRFEVAPGERFGLGARLVTPEGIPGPELRVDLIRRAPEEEAMNHTLSTVRRNQWEEYTDARVQENPREVADSNRFAAGGTCDRSDRTDRRCHGPVMRQRFRRSSFDGSARCDETGESDGCERWSRWNGRGLERPERPGPTIPESAVRERAAFACRPPVRACGHSPFRRRVWTAFPRNCCRPYNAGSVKPVDALLFPRQTAGVRAGSLPDLPSPCRPVPAEPEPCGIPSAWKSIINP